MAFSLRHRGWFLAVFLAVAVLIITLGYPSTTYTSVVSFVTEAQRGGTVANLAVQLGVVAPNVQNSFTSPLFYPELLRSQQFMGSVVEARIARGPGADSTTLIDVWGLRSPDPRMSRELASRVLDESMSVSVAPQTGIVKVAVTSDNPQLAQAIARLVLQKIQEFNTKTRQGRAAAERQFVERRLAEVRADLRAVEDRLETFLEQNRDFSKSASLQFQRGRLEQEVMLQRQITLAMAQSYEQAKIDEVRDTPVVTILSEPERPVLPNPRGRIRLGIMALFAAFGAGLATLYVLSQLQSEGDASEPGRVELARIASEIGGDLRRGRVIQAVFGRRQNGTATAGAAGGSGAAI